jgi:predicted transcriptional regulator
MPQSETLEMAAEVVAAFVSNNPLPKGELPALIQTIHDALTGLSVGVENAAPKEEPKQPAVCLFANRSRRNI